jgi:hypothetical protein
LQELESEHAAGPGHGGTDVNVDELLDDPELEALHRCDAQSRQHQKLHAGDILDINYPLRYSNRDRTSSFACARPQQQSPAMKANPPSFKQC